MIALAFALSHVAALAQSENLLPSGSFETVEDVKPWVSLYNAVPETEECAEGSQSMRITAYGWLLSPEMVEIDPVASYRLRAMVKLPETTLNPTRATEVTYALGLEMYDAQGRLIPNHGVVPIPGTETELLDAAEAGGIEVRVKGEWKRIEMGGIDYDGKASPPSPSRDHWNPPIPPVPGCGSRATATSSPPAVWHPTIGLRSSSILPESHCPARFPTSGSGRERTACGLPSRLTAKTPTRQRKCWWMRFP